ncbi:MAG: imidazole glycerol phosphate synthase subunit HisF [Gemmatimonadaceae bacterium]|nr:imidazole glycerol phosphate synthase subunit HisF [Gemmatimonadaceae bacterium]
MALKRIMPCLLFDGRALVKTVRFRNPQYIGDPINAIKIYNEKEVDELVLLDITASREKRPPHFDRIRDCASECFMPFTYGGGVQSIDQFARLYKLGVEKVVVNTLCLTSPGTVREATHHYGASSVVGAVDYRKTFLSGQQVYSASGGRTRRGLVEHCRYLADDLGVGEILLYSVDRDGTWTGYDLETIRTVGEAIAVPLIACGGAGNVKHLRQVLEETPANAAALGSMAVYQKQGMGVLINFPQRRLILDED